MKTKVMKAIAEYSLLERGDTVIAAVSGGADSVSLLHFLFTNRDELGITLRACHVNHNLRGEESVRDRDFVKRLCADGRIPLDILEEDIAALAKERGLSQEECGREVRYAFFEDLSRKYRARIATAHTLSDSAETVLFHLARGTGLAGLQGILPKRGNIIRPLLFCSREDIETYCVHNNISFVTDSTNLETVYSRNKIRHIVVPALCEINPAFLQAVSRVSRLARQDNDCLNALASKELQSRKTPEGTNLSAPDGIHPAVLSRMAALLLAEQGIGPSEKEIVLLTDVMEGKSGKAQFSESLYAEKAGAVLKFSRKTEEAEPVFREIPLQEGTFEPINGVIIHAELINCENFENFKKTHRNLLKNVINYDNIKSNPVIRARREHDKISLFPRGVTKSLKKLYNEAKIPVSLRDKIPVAADESGVLWASGFGCDSRAALVSGCRALCITVTYKRNRAET